MKTDTVSVNENSLKFQQKEDLATPSFSKTENFGKMSHFKLINSVKVNNDIPVQKYVSTETGIQVYVAQVESPVTSAFLALGELR